ncbi:hypothetical protein J3F83DRAFT_736013 [Trichoderma novae-zelandiae]
MNNQIPNPIPSFPPEPDRPGPPQHEPGLPLKPSSGSFFRLFSIYTKRAGSAGKRDFGAANFLVHFFALLCLCFSCPPSRTTFYTPPFLFSFLLLLDFLHKVRHHLEMLRPRERWRSYHFFVLSELEIIMCFFPLLHFFFPRILLCDARRQM